MNNIVKFTLFLLLLCYNNGLGLDFDIQDTEESNVKPDHHTNEVFSKNMDVFNTSVGKSKQNERNSEVRSLTTPLLPDDLTLEDDFTSEHNLRTPKNAAGNENGDSTIHNHPSSQEESSETLELKHTEASDATTAYDLEGSGDFLSTTLDAVSSTKTKSDIMTSFTPTISSSTIGHDSIDNILESCFGTVCNSTEIKIRAKFTMFVPESTNATVQCTSLGGGEYPNELRWYFVNETASILKHTNNNQTVSLQLSNAEAKDSGLYKCLKFKQDFCCHANLTVIVYEPPNYKLHILIAMCIAILGLVLCVVLTIMRTNQMKQYLDSDKAKRKQSASLLLL